MSRLFLAPMEGLADVVLRDVLTRIGGYDGAVTEFVRVSASLLPLKTYLRICPELAHASRTRSGTPVAVQLLGGDAQCMAENAAQLATLGPAGIDLNFGCPAPGVNRNGGGAILLDDPARIGRIAGAVRAAVPAAIPVSAKMRLGMRDTSKTFACAQALAEAGVASLVVHARTREEAYRPPAHWDWIAKIRERIAIPVIANGEVWSVADYWRCREVSGCADVMIGRGAVVDPFLALAIRAAQAAGGEARPRDRAADWCELLPLIAEFWRQVEKRLSAKDAPGRIKLWLNSLRAGFAEADVLYFALRPVRGSSEAARVLAAHAVPVLPAAAA